MGEKTEFLLFLKFLISSMILFWQTSLHSMISFDSSSSFEHHTIQMYGSMNFQWKTIYIYLFWIEIVIKKNKFFFCKYRNQLKQKRETKIIFLLIFFLASQISAFVRILFRIFFVVVVVASNLLTRRRVVFFCWFIL